MGFNKILALLPLAALASAAHATPLRNDIYINAGLEWDTGLFRQFIPEYRIHVTTVSPSTPPATSIGGIVLVPGFGDSGHIFDKLADQLIANGQADEVFIVDMPSMRGPSTLDVATPDPRQRAYSTSSSGSSSSGGFLPPPTPTSLQQIGVGEYASILDRVLVSLHASHKLKTIAGHSIGGLAIQLLQDWLVGQSSDLLAKYGIQNTVLIASDLPGGISWLEQGYARQLISQQYLVDSKLDAIGKYVATPYTDFIALKFTSAGQIVPGAPDAIDAIAINKPEPYAAAANIAGLDPTGTTTNAVPRIGVHGGLWTNRNLKVVGLSADAFFQQSEVHTLATYLKPGLTETWIENPNAVHGAPYSAPELITPLF
ncbi:MAG TPA: alpha/beta fold hydrolase [Rudaea sp.]|nr:alpha/beta fold hydrolase [Rudaea sp.]